MKKFLTKNKKYIGLILIAAIAFNFLFLPQTAVAISANPLDWVGQVFGWISGKSLLFISSTISMILGALFGLVLGLEAKIIDYIISPANFPLTTAPIVTLGWSITRDLANMFFILILLIIAFATVLKIQSYAIKQLWWKVVLAALLVNFSLVFAGFIIDFTQILTTFFLKQITGGEGGFGTITTKLAASMQILNFYNPAPPTSVLGGIGQFGSSAVAATVGVILTLVGLVITVFVFGAAMIFLILRILHLWFLLIIMPIVVMLWILPATSGQFSKWWNEFIKWAFFAPIYVFFIYLSLSIFDATGKLNPKVFGVLPAAWETPAPGLTTVAMPAAIFQWILVIAMMFGSLIVAQKMGVAGATESQQILKGWGDKSKNWAGRQLRSRVLGVGAKEAAPGVEARPGFLARGAQKLAGTKIPGGKLLADQIFKMTAGEAATPETAQKQFANWTPDAIQAYLKKSPSGITNAFSQNQQLGAALALKDKGKLDTLGEPKIKELAMLASRKYPKQLDEILKVAPHLAPKFNKNIKAVVGKIEKADEVMTESLSYPDVVMNFNPQQLKTIAQKGSDRKVNLLKNVVEKEYKKLYDSLYKKLDSNDESAVNALDKIGDIVGVEGRKPLSKEARNKALGELGKEHGEEIEKLVRAKLSTSSPVWDIG